MYFFTVIIFPQFISYGSIKRITTCSAVLLLFQRHGKLSGKHIDVESKSAADDNLSITTFYHSKNNLRNDCKM